METVIQILPALFVVFAILAGAYYAGKDIERDKWEEECIDRDVAEYNAKTGKWQWKGEPEKERKP